MRRLNHGLILGFYEKQLSFQACLDDRFIKHVDFPRRGSQEAQ